MGTNYEESIYTSLGVRHKTKKKKNCPGFEVSLMFLLASLQILFSGNSIGFTFFYSAGEASQSSPVSGS